MPSNFRYDLYPTRRKHCSRCGAWKQVHEFGVYRHKSGDRRLKGRCRTCDRLVARERGGFQPLGRRTHCLRGHPLKGDNVAVLPNGWRRCRACASSPERLEARRFREEARRRRKGIPRATKRLDSRKTPKNQDDPHRVPAGPFRDWVKERIEWIDCTKEEFATRTGIDARNIYGLLHGEYATVHIDTVDRALINELGTPWLLNELYPLEDDD